MFMKEIEEREKIAQLVWADASDLRVCLPSLHKWVQIFFVIFIFISRSNKRQILNWVLFNRWINNLPDDTHYPQQISTGLMS